MTEMTSGIS